MGGNFLSNVTILASGSFNPSDEWNMPKIILIAAIAGVFVYALTKGKGDGGGKGSSGGGGSTPTS